VDVVLNSLAGDFIPASIGALAPYGRFVEIGKRDIFANARIGLWPFRNNLSFFAVDMDRIFRDRPSVARALLDEIRAGFDAGIYRPLPRTTFPIGAAVSAFRYLAQARNIGKVVLTIAPPAAQELQEAAGRFALRPDATYLVTGGTRGLGGRVAEWMATLGARHLVLLGRDVDSPAARETGRRVAAAGAEPTMLAVDLGQPDGVEAMLATVHATLPPLRGIVHAAGVLADASVLNLDDDRFRSVFGSKAAGALLLHRATRDLNLDFFISFSSIASVLGNAGQANYAAANAVLDRLAWLRRSEGLAAQSINWGPWSEIGMSATAEALRMFEFGIHQISPDRGIAALTHLVDAPRPQSVVLSMDWPRFIARVPGAAHDPFLAMIREESGSIGEPSRSDAGAALSTLLEASPEARQGLLETFVRTELAKVLELEPEDLPLDQPLNTVGLDSLMALELKNRVESSLAISLPIVTLIQGPTVTQLAEDLLVRIEAASTSRDPAAPAMETTGKPTDVEAISAADVNRLLERTTQSPRL
jgi:NAD(P)-dependent dehydrogenase (short-subunit alcohol dehydrogenase family)/acyl carrier protein